MKRAFLLAIRLLLSFVVMVITFVAISTIIGAGSTQMTPEETNESGLALLTVSLANSLVLSFLILRSRWYGLTLVVAVLLVNFGVETFMSQIETVFFSGSVQMTPDVLASVILSGFLRALVFAPCAVLVWGKLKGPRDAETPHAVWLPIAEWVKRFALLAVAYVLVYLVFGYFVAWKFPDVREYYTGTAALLPFHLHLLNLITGDPVLLLFQLFRGVLWASLALAIVWMTKGKPWQISAMVALSFALLLSSSLIFPNPYMPAPVRVAHFLELASSMLVYGIIAGWVWTRPVHPAPELLRRVT